MSKRPTKEELQRRWEKGFEGYAQAVRERFAFLARHGYGAPKVSIIPRECTIVYWGTAGRANVVLLNDLGGPPWAQIVPLDKVNEDGSTRSFGLNEAVAILAPEGARQKPPPKPLPLGIAVERAWLDWYGSFLEAHLDAVTKPSTELLDAIEERRPAARPG